MNWYRVCTGISYVQLYKLDRHDVYKHLKDHFLKCECIFKIVFKYP